MQKSRLSCDTLSRVSWRYNVDKVLAELKKSQGGQEIGEDGKNITCKSLQLFSSSSESNVDMPICHLMSLRTY